jgi:hypothetical protein
MLAWRSTLAILASSTIIWMKSSSSARWASTRLTATMWGWPLLSNVLAR